MAVAVVGYTSDYPREHFHHSSTSKNAPGKMKDECAGIAIVQYVGLHP